MASAAYRAGEKLHSEYYGEDSDYTNKGGVICTEILLPDHVPKEYANRETLWNAVEKVEVGIVDATFFFLRFVNGEVHHHATADKMLGEKLSGKGNIFFLGKLILKGNIEAVGKLCFLSFLRFLHGVP